MAVVTDLDSTERKISSSILKITATIKTLTTAVIIAATTVIIIVQKFSFKMCRCLYTGIAKEIVAGVNKYDTKLALSW